MNIVNLLIKLLCVRPFLVCVVVRVETAKGKV